MLRDIFVARSIEHLTVEYLPRITTCLAAIDDETLWWQPPNGNSIGNLLRHLEGNVRQWILSGIGGDIDERQRASEFIPGSAADAEHAGDRELLIDSLRATLMLARDIIAAIDDDRLAAPVTIQGFATTGLAAVYHVVEHFSWHTGQITLLAKMQSSGSRPIEFYDDAELNERRNDESS